MLPPVRTTDQPAEQQKIGESLSDASGGEADEEMGDPLELGASGHELLRDKDFAEMTPDEYRRVRRLIAAIAESRPFAPRDAGARTHVATASTCAG